MIYGHSLLPRQQPALGDCLCDLVRNGHLRANPKDSAIWRLLRSSGWWNQEGQRDAEC